MRKPILVAVAAPPSEAVIGLRLVDSEKLSSLCHQLRPNRVVVATELGGSTQPRGAHPIVDPSAAALKSLTFSYGGVKLNKATGHPKQCRINIPYKIDPNTDCSR